MRVMGYVSYVVCMGLSLSKCRSFRVGRFATITQVGDPGPTHGQLPEMTSKKRPDNAEKVKSHELTDYILRSHGDIIWRSCFFCLKLKSSLHFTHDDSEHKNCLK